MPPARLVLIIDDSADIRLIARIALTSRGLSVLEAPGGEAGLALAHGESPDCVLLDVSMPGMSGPEMLVRMRQEGLDSPVVFLTGNTQPAEVERYIALGALGVIAKPFDPLTLAEQLQALLA